MDTLRIIRFAYLENYTLGCGIFGDFRFRTLENAWSEKVPWSGCIPEGFYDGTMGSVFRRDWICPISLHIPNLETIKRSEAPYSFQGEYCIAIGMSYEMKDGRISMRHPYSTFRILNSLLTSHFRVEVLFDPRRFGPDSGNET